MNAAKTMAISIDNFVCFVFFLSRFKVVVPPITIIILYLYYRNIYVIQKKKSELWKQNETNEKIGWPILNIEHWTWTISSLLTLDGVAKSPADTSYDPVESRSFILPLCWRIGAVDPDWKLFVCCTERADSKSIGLENLSAPVIFIIGASLSLMFGIFFFFFAIFKSF